MKFIIITTNGTRIIEADDFDEAADEAYDSHRGYRDVQAIVKMPEEEGHFRVLMEGRHAGLSKGS